MRRDDWTRGAAADLGVLRFMTCGSVDDGKSTLIGRLLYDTKALLADTVAVLERHAARRGLAAPDLALLTDGLLAEREQGITIDVAYRYFATARRSFIIADSPGHEQYTRNMVTAASTADAAVLLVDAQRGLQPQTFRHATLASLLGVRHLVLAVNKMDLVGAQQAVFARVVAQFQAWLDGQDTGRGDPARSEPPAAKAAVHAVPMSALHGDMVVERGEALGWYTGPTLIELLESLPDAAEDLGARPLTLPVQWVCRPANGQPRGYAGRLEAGRVAVGDEVALWPSGQRSRITGISIGETGLDSARAGQSVMVTLADERDLSRGDVIVAAQAAAAAGQSCAMSSIQATVCWLHERALAPGQPLLLQHLTRTVKARVEAVQAVLDVRTRSWTVPVAGTTAGLNDIVRLTLRTQQPLWAQPYRESRAGGAFILVDPVTRETLAGGLIG
ncbi:MAG: hypothetical protein RI988_881 [Pseudomonadota bacterium]|jgi:sulfate adenylyltransferase subunit 1